MSPEISAPQQHDDHQAQVEVPSAIMPTGEKIFVVGGETTVIGTIKVLEKYGFDRFRRLRSAEAYPAGKQA